uniref:Uncharacterized protein n=1 Tax=Hemiselmis tepida TaxID=464990 RepID=A0A7S0V847_9CRYP|mmetsp:Transcript_12484/g.32253  ORF Transcript_12484/g.32253 Transcript_12484/m.32253 type:complete len:118 (+) Transcript_12484:310-663(+)
MVTSMNRESSTACLAEYAFAMELDEAPASPGGAEREGKGHFICTWQDAFSAEAASSGKGAEKDRPCPARATRAGGQKGWPPGSLEEDSARKASGASTPPSATNRGFAPSSNHSDIKG